MAEEIKVIIPLEEYKSLIEFKENMEKDDMCGMADIYEKGAVKFYTKKEFESNSIEILLRAIALLNK